MTEQEPEDNRHQTAALPVPGRRRRLIGLNITHLLADSYGSLPAPLLRTFGSHLGVSYASVSLLLGFNSVANGLAGVVFGLTCDRWRRVQRHVILLAPAATVLAMSAIGIVSSYWLLMVLMATGAFACGAFHPPGFSTAGDIAHPNRARGVSIIMAVGIAGSSAGPLFVSQVVRSHGGVWATPLCALPGIALLAIGALLLRDTRGSAPPVSGQSEDHAPAPAISPERRWWLMLLFGNAALRAFAHMSVLVLISELMESAWGLSIVASGVGVGAMQFGAGFGGLLGARFTRQGRERRTILVCAALPVLVLLPMALAHGRIWWLLLLAYGACSNAPGPVVVSLAQRIAPHRRALVSGLMVGVAFAVGGQLAAITSPRILSSYGQAGAVGFLVVPLGLCWLTAVGLPKSPDAYGA